MEQFLPLFPFMISGFSLDGELYDRVRKMKARPSSSVVFISQKRRIKNTVTLRVLSSSGSGSVVRTQIFSGGVSRQGERSLCLGMRLSLYVWCLRH